MDARCKSTRCLGAPRGKTYIPKHVRLATETPALRVFFYGLSIVSVNFTTNFRFSARLEYKFSINSKPFPVETNARPLDGLRDLIEDFLHLRRSSLGATWVTVIFCDDELLLLIRVYYE
jgi:hypothetical protein